MAKIVKINPGQERRVSCGGIMTNRSSKGNFQKLFEKLSTSTQPTSGTSKVKKVAMMMGFC